LALLNFLAKWRRNDNKLELDYVYKTHWSVPYTDAIKLTALGKQFYYRWKRSGHTWHAKKENFV